MCGSNNVTTRLPDSSASPDSDSFHFLTSFRHRPLPNQRRIWIELLPALLYRIWNKKYISCCKKF
nr:MAG TPA: hypothetical protein [Caudoviricetes sp.]